MSRFQKGILVLVIAFVAVIAVGYAGMRYLENSVVEAVKTWAADSPENSRITFGDVRYSFKDNMLFLGKTNFAMTSPEKTLKVSIESLEIQGIGDSFLALLKDSKAQVKETEFLVAKAIVAKGIDTETLEQIPVDPDGEIAPLSFSTKAHIAKRTLSNLRMKTEEGRELFSNFQGEDSLLKLFYAATYTKGTASDLTLTTEASSTQDALVKLSAKEYTESNVGYGRIENLTFKDLTATIQGAEDMMSLDSVVLKDINFPPMSVVERIIEAGENPELVSKEEEAWKLLRDMFMSTGRPLCGEFAMNGLKISNAMLNQSISIGSFRITNSSITPFVVDMSMEHLVLPLTLDPQLQTLRLAGFEDMDLTTTLSFTGPDSSGALKVAGSLNLAQGGTLDVLFEGISTVTLDEWKKFNDSEELFRGDPVGSMGVFFLDNLKVVNMEMGYADEGLLPRGIKLAEIFMGLSAEQSIELLRQEIASAAQILDERSPGAAAKLNSFIDHPGAVRLSVKPEKPARLAELEMSPDIPLAMDVTTGPKSIEELVNELK